MEVVTRAKLACPQCGAVNDAEMPVNACQIFFECFSCRSFLQPQVGDCCMFCSYADVKCPPKQLEEAH